MTRDVDAQPAPRPIHRLVLAFCILVGLAFPLCTPNSSVVHAGPLVYDEPVLARAEAQPLGYAGASPGLLGAVYEVPASWPAKAPGASTTSGSRSVATNTATVRHYTTTEAAESITKAGKTIPGSSSGKTWLTPDEYLDGATAQSRLALNKTPDGYFEIPMCRVSCPSSPSRMQPYDGQPGGGIEITTNSTIDISGLPFIPFGPR